MHTSLLGIEIYLCKSYEVHTKPAEAILPWTIPIPTERGNTKETHFTTTDGPWGLCTCQRHTGVWGPEPRAQNRTESWSVTLGPDQQENPLPTLCPQNNITNSGPLAGVTHFLAKAPLRVPGLLACRELVLSPSWLEVTSSHSLVLMEVLTVKEDEPSRDLAGWCAGRLHLWGAGVQSSPGGAAMEPRAPSP